MVERGRLLHTVQQRGDDWLTRKLCVQILRKCLWRILFPSNTKLYFCPTSDLSFLHLKDNLLKKIPRLLFGRPFVSIKLSSSPSTLDTACSTPRDRPLPPSSLQSRLFLSTRCFSAYYAEDSFPNGCKATASWSTAERFPYLWGFFSLKPAEMNHLADPSSPFSLWLTRCWVFSTVPTDHVDRQDVVAIKDWESLVSVPAHRVICSNVSSGVLFCRFSCPRVQAAIRSVALSFAKCLDYPVSGNTPSPEADPPAIPQRQE